MPARITRRTLLKSLATVFLAAVAAHALGQTTEDDLKTRLLNKPLYLRRPWAQDHLKFDATGKIASKPEAFIPFTLCGIDIVQVQLRKDKLVIEGSRAGLEFGPNVTRLPLGDSINIEIAAPPGTDFDPALDNVFAETLSDLAPSLPSYWQMYAQKNLMTSGSLPANPPQPGDTAENSTFKPRVPLQNASAMALLPPLA